MTLIKVWPGGKSKAHYPLIEIEPWMLHTGEQDGYAWYSWHKGRRLYQGHLDDEGMTNLAEGHRESGNRIERYSYQEVQVGEPGYAKYLPDDLRDELRKYLRQ